MTRVLVLGATGMLGHVAVRTLAERFEVHATARDLARATALELPAELHAYEAATAGDGLEELVARVAPDVILNCVGLVKQLPIASEPVPAIAINALLPHRAADMASKVGARLIHVSTDCVFTGRLPIPERYTEGHAPDAEDLYGRSKLLGEVTTPGHLTLRTSIIGPELGEPTGLLEWFLAQEGPVVNGFTQAIYTGLTTGALAAIVANVIADHPRLAGLYQVASEPITKFNLLSRLNEVTGRGHRIVPVDEPTINRALDGSRFKAETGLCVPSWDEMLAEYATEVPT
jgi:dTDP-4-dehydrorhamnose reductase